MAADDSKDGKDGLRDILDKLETPAVRWALVCIGVMILVRLRLILFAAALPVMAYWHYSNRSEEPVASASDAPTNSAEDSRDDGFGDEDFGGPAKDEEVYDKDFWTSDGPDQQKAATTRSVPSHDTDERLDLDDDFPSSKGAGNLSQNMNDILGSLGSLGGGDDDFGLGKMDFLGSGGGDMDFLSGGFGGGMDRGKGKGKGGKGKGDFKGGEKGDKGPREPNPKQVFVAGVGELQEDEIRAHFEEIGEVDRLKVLTTPEGDPKGVCFVTFRTEEQAQQALGLHGSSLAGKNITVRLAHGGNKGKEGEKGEGKGKRSFDNDRAPMNFGPSERFGAAFGDDRGGGGDRPRGGGKGKGGRGRNERSELDELLDESLADQDGPVRAADFDFSARRLLSELRNRDKSDGTERFKDALDMVFKYTNSKERSAVRKWPAYVFTLLSKFDPQISEELRERDAARRAQRDGGGGGRPSDDRD